MSYCEEVELLSVRPTALGSGLYESPYGAQQGARNVLWRLVRRASVGSAEHVNRLQ